ncbi:AraC family transcriptional regulator [uncultured Roseobacter sp.]|uniref:helix-turn-helix domain-containing protein n=1 Tax=uncultured Roseobacter sp. TaxID=114847 RepID=UPI002612C19C|nr:AraC family transcriptional regulator [uncultured Roseobacter sp.]
MIFVPLPFVVTLLLGLLFTSVAWRDGERPNNLAFLLLIACAALQSLLIGLRFGYGIEWVRFLSPPLASVMAPLVYFGSLRLVGSRQVAKLYSIAPHGLPLVMILLSMSFLPAALDVIIVATFLVYAVLVLFLLRSGADALRATALDSVGPVHRSLVFAALVLIFSALVDTLIAIDVATTDARHLPQLVSIGNVAILLFLSLAAAVASRGRAAGEDERAGPMTTMPSDSGAAENPVIMAKVERLMKDTQIYRDADLNLARLARRAVIPSRQISGAINQTTGKNVSQYVNDFRIGEACEQLQNSRRSVTEIMFDVGFETKSNFNREFRRVTGMTPLEWRKAKRSRPDRHPDKDYN